jgi:RNA polymerase sigma-70 factor (ECF subfamily)
VLATGEDDLHREDVTWVRAVRGGDVDAYGKLVDRYSPRLHALLCRFLRDRDDVDDVLQEALVRAYRNLDRYDAGYAFYPWLRKIAVNLALNELQKRKRQASDEEAQRELERMESPRRTDRALEQRELHEALAAALEEIPPEWAVVFRLRTYEELSYAEIAQTLSCPIGTVMSQLARARARVARRLADRFGARRES